ncbi:MAG: PadR family transcriptional regulator [Angelakisella sp.]
MFDRSQLLKGTLEGCILKVVEQETTYGYHIVELLSKQGFSGLSEGTVYPLLLRLERKGLLAAVFRPSPLGPSRKYFSLTVEGIQQLREFEVAWNEIGEAVESILSYRGGNENG